MEAVSLNIRWLTASLSVYKRGKTQTFGKKHLCSQCKLWVQSLISLIRFTNELDS